MPESPPETQTSLLSPPGERSDQWLFDELWLGLSHLAIFRLPRTPATQTDLEDCAEAWVNQLRTWRGRSKPPSEKQIRDAFQFLGDTIRDRWPSPGDFLAALDRRSAPHIDGLPELPPSHPGRKPDHYAGERLELTPSAAEVRKIFAQIQERRRKKK